MGRDSTQQLLDSWIETLQSQDQRAGGDTQRRMQQAGLARLKNQRLPTRKDEAWKYTPLRVLEAMDPRLNVANDVPPAGAAEGLEVLDSIVVDIVDGELAHLPETTANGPVFYNLSDGLEWLDDSSLLNEPGDAENAFVTLNAADLEQGLVIRVPQGIEAQPIHLRFFSTATDQAMMTNFRLCIVLEANAQLQVVEQHYAQAEASQATNLVSQVWLHEGSFFDHVRLQRAADRAVLLTDTCIEQAAGSRFHQVGVDLGGALVRHNLHGKLSGENARVCVNGAYVLFGSSHVDNHVRIDHEAMNCRSEQFFRGVLGDKSHGVFNGKALIVEGADGSSVVQSNANLLLSREAEIDTKPELEIYADEVEASHGATVGQLDEIAVFYLRSRGLSDAQARQMLTTAFCHAVSERIADPGLAGQVAKCIDDAMSGSVRSDI